MPILILAYIFTKIETHKYYATTGSINENYNNLLNIITKGNGGYYTWNEFIAKDKDAPVKVLRNTRILSAQCNKIVSLMEDSIDSALKIVKYHSNKRERIIDNLQRQTNNMINEQSNILKDRNNAFADRNNFQSATLGNLNTFKKALNGDVIFNNMFNFLNPDSKLNKVIDNSIIKMEKIYIEKFTGAKNDVTNKILKLFERENDGQLKYVDLQKFLAKYMWDNNVNHFYIEQLSDDQLKQILFEIVNDKITNTKTSDKDIIEILKAMRDNLESLGKEIKESTDIIDASTTTNNSNNSNNSNKVRSREELIQYGNEYIKNNVNYNSLNNY